MTDEVSLITGQCGNTAQRVFRMCVSANVLLGTTWDGFELSPLKRCVGVGAEG